MSLQKNPHRLTLTVSIDDEYADIDLDPVKRVLDLIRHALVAFDIQEPAERCHLATTDRLYSPHQRLGDAGFEEGMTLFLRLPL
jgi:hypothetical protein